MVGQRVYIHGRIIIFPDAIAWVCGIIVKLSGTSCGVT